MLMPKADLWRHSDSRIISSGSQVLNVLASWTRHEGSSRPAFQGCIQALSELPANPRTKHFCAAQFMTGTPYVFSEEVRAPLHLRMMRCIQPTRRSSPDAREPRSGLHLGIEGALPDEPAQGADIPVLSP